MPNDSTNELMTRAAAATQYAHAPYSGFCVGAAVRCEDGTIFTGSNIENASYGLTVCAERVAIFKAITEGHRDLVELAVTAESDTTPYPCGACRQVMAEHLPPTATIQIAARPTRHAPQRLTLGELLPHAFDLSTAANHKHRTHAAEGATLDSKENDEDDLPDRHPQDLRDRHERPAP
jgi:cytidine deaminase